MKLHKILPLIFLIIAMMISCSQETVINENISGEATTPDTKICVNIKTGNSRTVRPEITKWEITVKLKNLNENINSEDNIENSQDSIQLSASSDTVASESNSNSLTFSRTIDGKATSATFVNVTDGEYEITVRGFNKDNKIILKNGSNSFYIKPNTVNVCEIIPEDNFDTSTRKGILDITVKISGLKDLFSDDKTIIAKITNNSESKSTALYFNSEKTELTGEITEIIPGSYKIEISNSKNLNLVKDPVVNIYPETTTEINWEWNYDSDEIKADQELKGIKIPVWNKPVFNPDFPEESSVPAKNGSLSANALFAEPTWDEEESYNFTYTDEKGISCNATNIQPSEFDFINCAYDDNRGLWVLSGTKSTISFYNENDALYVERFCYILKNLSTDEDYKFSCSDSLNQDFTVATIKEKKYLFSISSSGNNPILYAELKEDKTIENTNTLEGTGLNNLGNITTLYISRNSNTDEIPIYIAITSSDDNRTTANIYTGTISTDDTTGTPTLNINTDNPPLSLDIYSFISDENIVAQLQEQSNDFSNYAFMISDMYINEDKSKLYVTAGCVSYNYKSWRGNSEDGSYHSFGSLFEYTFGDDGKLEKDEDNNFKVISYGINNNYDVNNPNTPVDPDNENEADPNPFLANTTNPDTTNPDGGSQAISLETHIIQATSDDSLYFAGPRYIIPSGNDLLIIDSGFYGVYTTPNDNPPLINCEKRNRIFTFNTGTKGLSLTKVDDSISFDYDYLTSSRQY